MKLYQIIVLSLLFLSQLSFGQIIDINTTKYTDYHFRHGTETLVHCEEVCYVKRSSDYRTTIYNQVNQRIFQLDGYYFAVDQTNPAIVLNNRNLVGEIYRKHFARYCDSIGFDLDLNKGHLSIYLLSDSSGEIVELWFTGKPNYPIQLPYDVLYAMEKEIINEKSIRIDTSKDKWVRKFSEFYVYPMYSLNFYKE